ncbi:MAG: nucleotide exchange factor GrpE [Pyrinomonadaceae bacterium]
MNVNKEERTSNRIPVRFLDDEPTMPAGGDDTPDSSGGQSRDSGGELTPEEIGSQSSYEDATEVQRRIDRGEDQGDATGREHADDKDTAGAPRSSDLPEHRDDTDTKDDEQRAGSPSAYDFDNPAKSGVAASQSSVPPAANSAAAGPLLAELVATRAELKRLEAERADLMDKLTRRQADFENYRKRTERERGENYNKIVGDVVGNLLPVLDNLRRALDTESSLQAGESEEFSHFLQGVELITKQLSDVLEGLGLRPVEAVGQRFDPHLHEAVATESTGDYEPDTIIQELMRGYVLGEKLLRPAMVKVATR